MADFISEIRAFMDDTEVQELNIVQDENFKIESRDQANYFVRKVMALKEEEAEIMMAAKQEAERLIGMIKEWEEKELTAIHTNMEYFNGALREYATNQLVGSSKRSIKLPFGTLQFRAQQPKFNYDEDLLKTYLQSSSSDLVEEKIEYKVNKVELKKRAQLINGILMLDGAAVDGVTIEVLDDKFEVK